MSRGGFPGGFGGEFGGMRINQLMKQAKKMQEEMTKTQENLTSKEFEGTAGGEAVYVKVNGKKQVIDIKKEKEVDDPNDIEIQHILLLIFLLL